MSFDVAVLVKLLDRFSQPGRNLVRVAGQLGNAFKTMERQAAGGGRGVDRMGQFADRTRARYDRLRTSIETLGHSTWILSSLQQTGDRMLRAMGKPIGKDMAFQDRLIMFGNTAGMVGNQLRSVEDRLDGISKVTSRPTGDLLTALEILVGKGMAPDTALAALEKVGRGTTATGGAIEDISGASFSVIDNLGVRVEDLGLALDAMSKAGKSGGFELKNMAKEFPTLTAGASALGMKGVKAVADLSAALQVALKGAGSPDQAANNLVEFMNKITAPDAVKNFKSFGINVEKELAKAAKAGTSPIEHMLDVINKVTKGNQFKLNEIFGDKQAKEFIRPLLQNMDEYRRIRADAMNAQGTVDADYDRAAEGMTKKVDRLKNSWDALQRTIGAAVNPVLGNLAEKLTGVIDRIDTFAAKHPTVTAVLGGFVLAVGALATAAGGIGQAVIGFAGFLLISKFLLGFVPGARLAGGVARLLARSLFGIGRAISILLGFGGGALSGFFSGLGTGAAGAVAEVGGAAAAVGMLSTRLRSLLKLRNLMKLGGALAIGSEIVDDVQRTPEQRIEKFNERAKAFKSLEDKLEQSAPGRLWKNLQEAIHGDGGDPILVPSAADKARADAFRQRNALPAGPGGAQSLKDVVTNEVDQSRTTTNNVTVNNSVTVNATTNASPGSIGGAVAGAAESGTRRGLGNLHDGGDAGSTHMGQP